MAIDVLTVLVYFFFGAQKMLGRMLGIDKLSDYSLSLY